MYYYYYYYIIILLVCSLNLSTVHTRSTENHLCWPYCLWRSMNGGYSWHNWVQICWNPVLQSDCTGRMGRGGQKAKLVPRRLEICMQSTQTSKARCLPK